MKLFRQAFFFSVVALVTCVSRGPEHMGVVSQDLELGALRRELSHVTALPEAWLSGYYAAPRNCFHGGVSRIFRKTYERKVGDRTAWLVYVLVRVACSEEVAIRYLELHCRRNELYSGNRSVEIVADSLGRFCLSPVVSMPRPLAFRSFVGVQSGILGVSFYESNYGEGSVAKQIVIDDLAARLRRANEQNQPNAPSEQ